MEIFKKFMAIMLVINGIAAAGILSYICILLISSAIMEKINSPVDDNVKKYSSPGFEPERIKVQCVENNLVAILVSSTGTANAMIPILNADGSPKTCVPTSTK